MVYLSKTGIYNLALAELGGDQLSTVELEDDSNQEALLCKNLYPFVLRDALSYYDWSFATKRIVLARLPDDETPYVDYPYAFALPADYMRIIRLCSDTPFIINGRTLYTISTLALLIYVALIEDISFYPPEFVSALACGLAAKLATAKNSDPRKQEYCRQQSMRYLAQAVANDQNANKPWEVESKWLKQFNGRVALRKYNDR